MLTALVLCAVFLACGLFPFGGNTLAWGDMTQQVIPLMLDLKDILAGNSGFFLNLQNAGGMNFFGVFFFFLSSPFTFLIAFLEKGEIYYLVNVLVLLKLSLSAATASCFFHAEHPHGNRLLHLVCSVSYGLCGYGLLYYQNIVWLDVLCLFPLLMLSFLKLIDRGKVWPFTTALSLMLIFNYYLSYMVFLALILVAALYVGWCVPKEKRGEAAGRIGGGALCSLLLTAVVWVPSFLQCLRSARTDTGIVENIQKGGFFASAATTLPVLLCTSLVISIPLIYWYHPRTKKRKALLLSFVLTALPLWIEPINKLWHTGSYQAFPARYGYIPLFLGLWYIADIWGTEEEWTDRKNRFWPAIGLLAGVAAVAGLGLFQLFFQFEEITSYNKTLWVDEKSIRALLCFSLLALCIALLGWYLYRKQQIQKNFLCVALLLLTLFQGGYHAFIYIAPSSHDPAPAQEILALDKPADSGLYRAKLEYKFLDMNLLGAMGLPTLNHYTSLTDETFLHTLKKLGYSSYWMETSGCCGTAVSDLLLSNKYVLTDSRQWVSTGSGNLGYLFPSGTLPKNIPTGNRLEAQDELFRRITGSHAFRSYTPVSWNGQPPVTSRGTIDLPGDRGPREFHYEIPIQEQETLYFDLFGENTSRLNEVINGICKISVNGKEVQSGYPSQKCNGIFDLGTYQNETVTIDLQITPVYGLTSFGVYGLPAEKVSALTDVLHNADLQQEGSRITGTVQAREKGASLFLSIPYAPGMKAKVNGKPVELAQVLDCFLEIPLEQGINQIEFSYFPAELIPGILLSATGAVLSAAYLFLRKSRAVAVIQVGWRRAAYPLLWTAFSAVLLLIYLVPVVLWFF